MGNYVSTGDAELDPEQIAAGSASVQLRVCDCLVHNSFNIIRHDAIAYGHQWT
jgi:hypothetical protein